MFLDILKIIWEIGIMIWFAFSTVYTIKNLIVKIKEKRKE